MNERTGIYLLLKIPTIYEAVQRAALAFSPESRATLPKYAKIEANETVLDIGCGTGAILDFIRPDANYIGFEPNALYVEKARARHNNRRAEFFAGYFDQAASESIGTLVDVTLLSAVLHHLDDQQAISLFGLIKQTLKPGGRLVCLDAVFHDEQSFLSWTLARLDRGKHVRTPAEYKRLVGSVFGEVDGELRFRRFPPYSLWLMTAKN